MKYGIDASLCEIARRKNEHLRRRTRKMTFFTGGAAVLFGILTFLSFAYALPRSAYSLGKSDYGAFLLDGNAGAYVLVGVLAFALGASFTLLCVFLASGKKAKSNANKDQNDRTTED